MPLTRWEPLKVSAAEVPSTLWPPHPGTCHESLSDLKVKVLVAQSCLTLCDPMNCSLPGSSVQGILQARILEWVAMASSRGSFQPRDRTQVSDSLPTEPLSDLGDPEFLLWLVAD